METRKIRIRRKEGNSELPKEVTGDAKVKIGSIYKHRAPLSAFESREEEDKYLSEILSMQPTDQGYREKVKQFWAEMTIEVPFGGIELDISMKKDANGNDVPVHINDYLAWRWALRHRYVANTPAERGDAICKYYIEDPVLLKQQAKQKRRISMMADELYSKVLRDPNQVRMVLTMMSPETAINNMGVDDAEELLYELKNTKPKLFVGYASDKNLREKAEIQRFIKNSVVKKTGTLYSYMDQPMGTSMEEAIAWMTEPTNSEHVLAMRATLEEAERHTGGDFFFTLETEEKEAAKEEAAEATKAEESKPKRTTKKPVKTE